MRGNVKSPIQACENRKKTFARRVAVDGSKGIDVEKSLAISLGEPFEEESVIIVLTDALRSVDFRETEIGEVVDIE